MIPGKGMPCFPVFEDNRGALQLSKNPVSNSNSKHIDVRHHFLRELVGQGEIIVNHVPSEYQHADVPGIEESFSVGLVRDPPAFLDESQ